jgi:hypothetical protein
MRLMNLLGDQSTNMDATNEYEDRNSPAIVERVNEAKVTINIRGILHVNIL